MLASLQAEAQPIILLCQLSLEEISPLPWVLYAMHVIIAKSVSPSGPLS